ncbi:WUSCHEL-related homeobox 8-like isoform X2 [Iris pallida]|uniref:WUSCHEL-related homeobox 8-like isoform X2 n=1 Tax=Iris pallida TaxID=29817 RepID=A0AAX6H898_IRIPA|nr:WUSCHEL-related homeobox 8-like isoform X2 [Iris pallida]
MGEVRGGGRGAMDGNVMTEEQLEDLRRQISIYATICEQLVEMHKSHHHPFSGTRLGSLNSDLLMTSNIHRIAARQRWSPTAIQLQILENIFGQGNGIPSKQRIKEITIQLTQHGQVSETNVYNWFQNRRARSKRKQPPTSSVVAGSEFEEEIESPSEKETCYEKLPSIVDDLPFHTTESSSQVRRYIDPEPKITEGMSQVHDTDSLDQMSFYQSILSNPRIDHLAGMMESPGSCSPFRSGESSGM